MKKIFLVIAVLYTGIGLWGMDDNDRPISSAKEEEVPGIKRVTSWQDVEELAYHRLIFCNAMGGDACPIEEVLSQNPGSPKRAIVSELDKENHSFVYIESLWKFARQQSIEEARQNALSDGKPFDVLFNY